MFARIKKSGRSAYLQIVENRREEKKIIRKVIAGKIVATNSNGTVTRSKRLAIAKTSRLFTQCT